MSSELIVAIIVIAAHGRLFQGSVHALDLPIRPGMIDLCETMLDAMFVTYAVENVVEGVFMPLLIGELNTVVGQNGMYFIRHDSNEVAQELSGLHLSTFLMQLGIGELGGAIYRHEQAEFAFLRVYFGNVDMEVADGILFELLLRGLVAFHFRQAADAMALITSMQRRSCQMGNGGLQRIQTIVQGQKRMLSESHGDGLFFNC